MNLTACNYFRSLRIILLLFILFTGGQCLTGDQRCHFVQPAHAQPFIPDISDPWGAPPEDIEGETSLENKSAEELTTRAEELLSDDSHLLEARTILLNAIRKDPSYYPAHLSLGYYYLAHVSHFRLAMRYIKRAQQLFSEQKGEPPYSNRLVEAHHAQILYLLSQARLNLDDYAGALSVLDTIKSYGYFTPSYAGSRAWVLMKLGRVDEAIREAKMGLLMRAEPARTLNMLGILLSMNNQPEAALEALKRAAAIETSLGKQGQPATPINNSGEVYKEMFEDEKAEASWIKAKSFHDGCEHVLPSLNLALLYLDQLKLRDAEDAISSFLSCVAQYTLRSDEEHRALVNLARARFKLHGGKPEEALKQLQEAFDNIQWFGKIGTNQDDLEIGITITKAQAWRALAERMRFKIPDGIVESMQNRVLIAQARVASWWFFRKAARVLVERLKNIEDLTIRNTDSLIEYSTFGSVLSVIPSALFERRLEEELNRDKRPLAQVYYAAYRGENYLRNGKHSLAITTLKDALQKCRPTLDDGLRLRILILLASVLEPTSSDYAKMTEQIFLLSPPALRNAGLRLPAAVFNTDSRTVQLLKRGGFLPVETGSTPFTIEEDKNSVNGLNLVIASGKMQRKISAQGESLAQAINNLNEATFTVAGSVKNSKSFPNSQ